MDVIPEADRRGGYVRVLAETGCRLSCFDQCLNRSDAAISNRVEIALTNERRVSRLFAEQLVRNLFYGALDVDILDIHLTLVPEFADKPLQ